MRRLRTERGTMLVEFTWLGILLLVPLVYVLLTVFEVQRGAFAVTAAARSAGRAYAVAPTADQAQQRARAAVEVAMADQDLAEADRTVQVACRPEPGDCLVPGSTISVTVRSRVDLPLVPAFLGETPSIRVSATHDVPRGRYRSN